MHDSLIRAYLQIGTLLCVPKFNFSRKKKGDFMSNYMLVEGNKLSATVSSANYEHVTATNDDAEITANVIKGVAEFMLKSTSDYNAVAVFNQLKARPITHEKCTIVRKLIDELPMISVVPSEVNYHQQSGLYKFYWERSLRLDDEELIGLIGEEGVEALRGKTTSMTIDLLTISQSASDALNRYTEKLRAPKPSYTQSYRPIQYTPPSSYRSSSNYRPSSNYNTYNYPLLREEKDRSCKCTIL